MLDVFMTPAVGLTAAGAVWLLVAHLLGDYVLQSDWMATTKTERWWPAILHGVLYGLPFVLVVPSVWAWLVIAGTHVVIDRYRLAKYLVWAKNQIAPAAHRYRWGFQSARVTGTGTPEDPYKVHDLVSPATNHGSGPGVPAGLAAALVIAVDNTVHLVINLAAVVWL